MTELTKGQAALADEVASLLAEAALPPDITEQMIANLGNLSEQDLVQLVRWLSDRSMAINELETALVDLQKRHEADWKALEKEQQKDIDDILNQEIAAATGAAKIDSILAAVDEE
jgi:hypothetical protein